MYELIINPRKVRNLTDPELKNDLGSLDKMLELCAASEDPSKYMIDVKAIEQLKSLYLEEIEKRKLKAQKRIEEKQLKTRVSTE